MAKQMPSSVLSAGSYQGQGIVNWRNILLAVALVALSFVAMGWALTSGGEEKEDVVLDMEKNFSVPKAPDYDSMKPKDQPTAAPTTAVVPANFPGAAPMGSVGGAPAGAAARGGGRRAGGGGGRSELSAKAKLLIKAAEEEPSVIAPGAVPEENREASASLRAYNASLGDGDADGTDFVPGATCQVNAGTAIKAKLTSAVSTAQGGTVRAMVDQDVHASDDPNCEAIPWGSTMVGTVERTENRGQREIVLLFTSITRPAPRNDTLTIKLPGSDAMGRGGLQGNVEGHFWSQAGLVLAATVVDIGTAILSGGGGAIGILGGIAINNADQPLDKAARDRLDLPSTITLDPMEDDGSLTIILQEHINADNFDQ